MIAALFRVLIGFVAAVIVAATVMVAFAGGISTAAPPADTFELVLLTATHSALFAAAFALISAGIAEWQRIRSWLYHSFAGGIISMLGFVAQGSSEIGNQSTIFNRYAAAAYLAAGLIGGLSYWLFAGRRAGGRRGDPPEDDDVTFAPEDSSVMQARLPAPETADERNKPAGKSLVESVTDPA